MAKSVKVGDKVRFTCEQVNLLDKIQHEAGDEGVVSFVGANSGAFQIEGEPKSEAAALKLQLGIYNPDAVEVINGE